MNNFFQLRFHQWRDPPKRPMLTSTYESFNFMFNFYNQRNLLVTPAFRFKPMNNYCRCVGKFTRKDDNLVFFELSVDSPTCNTYCAF